MIEIALAAQVAVWLAVLVLFLASGQASIYHPLTVYLAFHLIVFVVRPVLVLLFGFEQEWLYMEIPASERHVFRALAVSSLGLVVFAGASVVSGWSDPCFKLSLAPCFSREQLRALLLTTLTLGPLVVYSLRAVIAGDATTELRGNTIVMTGVTGYTVEAQHMAGALICAWLLAARFRWYALLVLAPYMACRAYIGTSRWTIVLLFLALGLVYAWQHRRRWLPASLVLCVVPLFLLFNFLGANRTLLQSYFKGEDFIPAVQRLPGMSQLDRVKAKFDGPDFANFDFLTYIVSRIPERTEAYTYGAQYLQLFTEPIPRKLWPGKPTGAPVRTFNLNDYGNFTGRTVTLVGDGWVSGGWIGVVLTMTLVGMVLGWCHRWFWRNADSVGITLLYTMGLAMLPQWFRDGGISIAKFLFWELSPLVLWLLITWVLGPKRVPLYSVSVPPKCSVRLLSFSSGLGRESASQQVVERKV